MAKLNLSTKEDKVYGEFTKGYRLSTNVIDRRGKQQYHPTETTRPNTNIESNRKSISVGKSSPLDTRSSDTTNQRVNEGAADSEDWQVGRGGLTADVTPKMKPGQSRKVDPDEALSITNSRE